MGCHSPPVSWKVGKADLDIGSQRGNQQDRTVFSLPTELPGATVPLGEDAANEAAAFANTQHYTIEDLSRLTVRELKELVRTGGGDPAQYLEKQELVEAVWSLNLKPGSPSWGVPSSDARPIGSPLVPPPPPPPPPPKLASGRGGEASTQRIKTAEALFADVDDAAEVVRRHCEEAVENAAACLEEVWSELLPEVAKTEFVVSIADAVKARNVFGLIDATLELKRAGTPVARKVEQLAYEASVEEESWLVRKSILDAVLQADADEIELWAEQARAAGEDVTVEMAYAEMLRWADKGKESTHSRGSSSSSTSSEDHDVDPLYNEVGGDEGIGGEQPRSSPPSWHESWRDWERSASDPRGSEDVFQLREPGNSTIDAVVAALAAAEERERAPRQRHEPSPAGRAERPKSALPGRVSAPYSAAGTDLGTGVREVINQSKQTAESKYDAFWEAQPRPARPASASTYTYRGQQVPKDEESRANRYNDFWGQTPLAGQSRGAAQTGPDTSPGIGPTAPPRPSKPRSVDIDEAFPRYAEFRARFESAGAGEATVTGPPTPSRSSTSGGTAPASQEPPRGQGERQVPHVAEEAPSRPPPTRPPPYVPPGTQEAMKRPGSAARLRPGEEPSAKGQARRVRLMDFLQAQSNQSAFAAAMGYTTVKSADPQPHENSPASSKPGPPPMPQRPPPQQPSQQPKRTPPAQPTRPPPRQPSPPPVPPAAPKVSPAPSRPSSRKEQAADQGAGTWWKPWTRFTGGPSNSEARSTASARQSQSSTGSFASQATQGNSAGSGSSSSPTNFFAGWTGTGRKFSKDREGSPAGSRPAEGKSTYEKFRESREKAREDWEKQKQAQQDEEEKRWEEQNARNKRRGARPRSYRPREEPRGATAGDAKGTKKSRSAREMHLELLGFGPDAEPTQDELKKAYRVMAMRWHPDRPHNRDNPSEATEKFQAAKDAYDYFMEEHKKR